MTIHQEPKTVWQTLENHEMPNGAELLDLSGLLGEDIDRLAELWPQLPVTLRQDLAQTLNHMAEVDFEMDFYAVFRLALRDTDPTVRCTAIEGLHEVEDVRLITVLIQRLQEDESAQVRAVAAQALAKFVLLGELKKIHQRPFDRAYAALVDAHTTEEEDLDVRRYALESLAYTGGDAVETMIQTAYTASEERMRISAVFAMGRSADQRWETIVRRELDNPNPAMRYEAVRACGELQLQDATRDLVELTQDVDPEIQQMALWSLGQIGGRLAQRTLERYTHSDNEALRTAAQEALSELQFFHSDISSFFGPPADFQGESELTWAEADELREQDDEDDLNLLEDLL